MKIVLAYMDVTNLGDIVIYENARYILEDILNKNELTDCEIVPVDIGEYRYKEHKFSIYRRAVWKVSRFVTKLFRKKKIYRRFPWLTGKALKWSWHRTPQYRYFKRHEKPKMKGADIILFGGGGLIKYHKQTFHYSLNDITLYAEKHGIPVLLSGVGVEGYKRKDPECKILKHAINRNCVQYISSRDDFATLEHKYVKNENIEICEVCDPAFWTKETYGIERKNERSKVVGLNVIRFPIFKAYMYKVEEEVLDDLYVGLIRKLWENGYKVQLFSNGVKGDTEYIERLITNYPELVDKYEAEVKLPETTRELVSLIAGFDRFMAVRLHASIIGSVLGVPNISLVWNIKQVLFGEKVGKPQNYLLKDDFDADTVYERLVSATPYVMDPAYKQTVYDNLEKNLLRSKDLVLPTYGALNWGWRLFTHGASGFAGKLRGKIRGVTKRKYIRTTSTINKNKIAIMTNTFHYTCNPKYIYQELKKREKEYDIVWLTSRKQGREGYPDDARIVEFNSEEGLREVYSAKLWLDNGIAFSNFFDKKRDQVHVQTMHGSLGIKKIDNAKKSRNERGRRGRRVVKRETNNTDYVITNSSFEEGVFRRVFWENTPMVRLGHARTDILFEENPENVSKIRNDLFDQYGIPIDTAIFLYGPTHRKGLTKEDLYLDYEALRAVLKERFGQDFSILLRLHDRTKDIIMEDELADYIYDVTDYPDMQELMLVTDVGVTDYSSWIFDYVLRRRPGFMYATDLDRYDNRTGLVFPLEASPFPAAYSNEQLIERIRNFDEEKFQRDVEAFLQEKESVDEGHSAKDIVDWMEREILR